MRTLCVKKMIFATGIRMLEVKKKNGSKINIYVNNDIKEAIHQ